MLLRYGTCALLLGLLLGCESDASDASAGRRYGAELSTDALPVTPGSIVADPDAYDGKKVRVAGQVVGVCAKRGCWIEIAEQGDARKIKFKVDDGVMVFPTEEQGHYAVAEGVVRKIPLDLEQTRAYLAEQAREAGKEFDPASVTQPVAAVMLKGLGAIIKDRP